MARIYHTDRTEIDSEVKARVWRLQCTPGISRERRVDEGKHVGSCSHEKWSLSLLLKRLGILTAQLTTPDSAKHHGKSFIYVYSLSLHNPQGGWHDYSAYFTDEETEVCVARVTGFEELQPPYYTVRFSPPPPPPHTFTHPTPEAELPASLPQ